MPWKGPDPDGDAWPTLGHDVAAWIEANLIIPDRADIGKPFILTDEQYMHLLQTYRLKPHARPEMGSSAFQYYGALLVRPQKALALSTPIATPSGWTTMGDLQPGDVVFDRDGAPTQVLVKSPVWDAAPTYRVTFSDGAQLTACADHVWHVDRRTPSSTYVSEQLTTKELLSLGVADKLGARRFRVRNAGPLQLPSVDLPVPPYTLGAWLGDGDADAGRVTGIDREVFASIQADGFRVGQRNPKRWQVFGLVPGLRAAGVFRNKHIPAAYLRASVAQRWALLQGLMDTDGFADALGRCEFTTVLPALRDGFRELLYTLGIRHTCYEGRAMLNGRDYGLKWRIGFTARADVQVFCLERKQRRLKATGRNHAQFEHRRIVDIAAIEPEPTQCITVASSTHTFLAGREMIPTGNSGKDPLGAAQACVQALGPVRFAGWDADGEPVGAPMPTPWIQCAANSEEQVENTFRPIYTMLTEGPIASIPGLDVGLTRVNLPSGGRIEPVTAAAKSRLGARITFATFTESGLYTASSGGVELARTMKRGLAGMDGRWMELTNAWDPAERSVAQQTYEAKAPGVYIDYRPPRTRVDFDDDAAMRAELSYVYGDAALENGGWVNLERIIEEARDPATGEGQARRFFLNEITVGSKDALDTLKWAGQARLGELLAPGERVALGFHGTATRDATSLCASRMSDGRLFHLRTWERPFGHVGDWQVPRPEVNQAIDDAFAGYEVACLFATPATWQDEVNTWAGKWPKRVLELWLNSEIRMDQVVERFETAHRANELTHDGSEILTTHATSAALANGKRRASSEERVPGLPEFYQRVVRKSWAQSVSAFIAALLAYEARGWALERPQEEIGEPQIWLLGAV